MTIVFNNMTREELEAAYNNTKVAGDFPSLLRSFNERGVDIYKRFNVQRNISYLDKKRTTFDYFPAKEALAPTFIFIHGGYWQNCVKEDYAFMLEGILESGINVVLAEYTLAPEASMTDIVGEIKALLDYLEANQEKYQITKGKVCLAGHSAGGHLTAVHRNHPLISHAMPISALVDLYPISLCWLNDKLSLIEQEIKDYSPIAHVTKGVPTTVVVGAAELSELVRHSKEYYEKLVVCDNQATYIALEGHKHFSLLNEFGRETGLLLKALQTLLKQ